MAFPQVRATTYSTETADTTSHDVDMTGVQAGDRAILFAVIDNDGSSVTVSNMPAGWTLVSNDDYTAGGGQSNEVWEKIGCTGSETSFQYTTDSSQKSKNRVFFITGSHASSATEDGTWAKTSATTPDPPSLTASWGSEDTLWIAFYSADNQRGAATAYPTNYSSNQYTNSVTTSDDTSVAYAVATRENATATENPGTFTKSDTDRYAANTFAVRPSAGATGTGSISETSDTADADGTVSSSTIPITIADESDESLNAIAREESPWSSSAFIVTLAPESVTVVTPLNQVEVIQSDALEVTIGLELLDANLNLIEDLSDDFAGGSIAHGNFRSIHSTFSGTVSRVLQWESARLRPFVILRDMVSDTEYRWDLGVYLPETVSRLSAEDPKTWQVEGYDLTAMLDTPIGQSYSVESGAAYLDAVADLLDSAGITSYIVNQNQVAATLPASRSWPLEDDTTFMKIINDLLAEINYRPIWMDRQGALRAEPYVAPSDATIVYTYDAYAINTIVEMGAQDEQDLWQVPNRWVFVADQPGELDGGDPKMPTEGDGIYTVTNETDGPSSIQARGRVVTRIWKLRAADQTALEAQGDAVVEQTRQTMRHLSMTTGPNPIHWHWDVSQVIHPDLGIAGRWQTIEWELDLDGGAMRHQMREV